MEVKAIAEALANKPKGSIFQIVVRRPAKCYKGVTHLIEKESHYQGQFTDYARRAPVREAVEAGEREAPETPTYVTEVFMEGKVKFWKNKNGQVYFPMPVSGNKPNVTWYMNDEIVTHEDVLQFVTSEEKKPPTDKEESEGKGQVLFNAIKVENIMSIK